MRFVAIEKGFDHESARACPRRDSVAIDKLNPERVRFGAERYHEGFREENTAIGHFTEAKNLDLLPYCGYFNCRQDFVI